MAQVRISQRSAREAIAFLFAIKAHGEQWGKLDVRTSSPTYKEIVAILKRAVPKKPAQKGK
jgi:hypothetical protein